MFHPWAEEITAHPWAVNLVTSQSFPLGIAISEEMAEISYSFAA